MLESMPPLPEPEREALVRLGDSLRALGYLDRPVSQAMGVVAWDSRALDAAWWRRGNHAQGALGVLIDLLIRGARLPVKEVRKVLPEDAWRAQLVKERRGDAWMEGILLPLGEDYIWTDRAERSFEQDGLFLPDSSSLALRRCRPPGTVGRHLDLGAGAGSVTVAAARRARETVALDLEPRFAAAMQRTLALNGLRPAQAWLGRADEAGALGRFDRVSFVLPLLVSWEGLAEIGPVHTISGQPRLLVQTLRLLAEVLEPGGVATLYTQDWTPDSSLRETIDEAMGERSWSGAFWWDTSGEFEGRLVRTGVLGLRMDGPRGFHDARNEAPDLGDQDWWPHLAAEIARGEADEAAGAV